MNLIDWPGVARNAVWIPEIGIVLASRSYTKLVGVNVQHHGWDFSPDSQPGSAADGDQTTGKQP